MEFNEISFSDQREPRSWEGDPDDSVSVSSVEEFHTLDPNYVSAERAGGMIFLAFVMAGALIGLTAKWLHGGFDWVWFLLAGLALGVSLLLTWSAIFWPAISYRHIRWKLDETGLEIQKGVWWKNRSAVPLARVQHADVTQGPIQRNYGIGTLTVHTAGTSNASVDLSGLPHAVALELRDRLVRQERAGGANGSL